VNVYPRTVFLYLLTCIVRRIYTATVETGVLQLQVRSCGTTVQLNCEKLTLASNDLNGYRRHFCSGAEIAAHCDLLTYLITLLSRVCLGVSCYRLSCNVNRVTRALLTAGMLFPRLSLGLLLALRFTGLTLFCDY